MPLDTGTFYTGFTVIALTISFLSISSGFFKYRVWISEPLVCLVTGVVVGPYLLDLVSLDIHIHGGSATFLAEVARLTLAVAIVGAALRLPDRYFRKNTQEMTIILVLGMTGMALVSAGLSLMMFEFSLLGALLLGAVLAPTDPVLSAPIVTGKLADERIPRSASNLITAESGSNDGAALALVLIPLEFARHAAFGSSVQAWLVQGLLWEVGVALVTGTVLGHIAGRVHQWSSRQPWSEPESLQPIALALVFSVLGINRVLGTDGLLACFVAGTFLRGYFPDEHERRQLRFREGVGRFFDFTFFLLLGAALPLSAWWQQLGLLTLFGVAILLLRRLPLWMALAPALRPISSTREAAFVGWFGPIGASTIFYALEYSGKHGLPNVFPMASFVVACSVAAHGISSTPLARRTFR